MARFSIIIPCYNLQSVISRTIDSVLEQQFSDFEIIVVDDGSTDRSLEIVKSYQVRDSRIKVYEKRNGGVSSARNLGLQNSTGEYVYFLDGDDTIENDLLSVADLKIRSLNIDMFSFGYIKKDNNLNQVIRKYYNNQYSDSIFTGTEFQKLYFSKKISQCMCSFIVKRDITVKNNIEFNETTEYGEDQEFQIRCNMKSGKIFYDSKPYFNYIQRSGSAVNKKLSIRSFDVLFRIENYINSDLIKHYQNFLVYMFIYYLKEAKMYGIERDTLYKLLSIDYVLDNFNFKFNKVNLLTAILIIYYKKIYKKNLLMSE